MKKILFCFGTRPEVIKMAPVIKEAQAQGFKAEICLTGQHKEMLLPFLDFFELKESYSLEIPKNLTLIKMNSLILEKMENLLSTEKPDYIAVQGDTTSTFACALAGFFHKIPIIHIEAGLRTFDKYSPFPEEINRQMVSTFSSFNFCPTEQAKKHLLEEKRSQIFVTGNTSIDSLRLTMDKLSKTNISENFQEKYQNIDFEKPLILVTCHRRENHGAPLESICEAILKISKNYNCEIIYPVHLNPNVYDIVHKRLRGIKNIHLLPPLEYVEFSWFMQKSYLILTDSGGVQEEAPYLKKPILVLRESTERQEVIDAKVAKLVGSNVDKIIASVNACLNNKDYYHSFQKGDSPYGDGFASKKIIKYLKESINEK